MHCMKVFKKCVHTSAGLSSRDSDLYRYNDPTEGKTYSLAFIFVGESRKI